MRFDQRAGVFSLLVVLLCLTILPDSPGPHPEPLHPCEYAFESSFWVLRVEPSQRYGAGPARYEMRHAGELVWACEHSFTFKDARVSSDGSVVGHASSTGRPILGGEVVVAILAPDGSVRDTTREPYVWHHISRPPYPQVQSLDLRGDLVSVRVSGSPSGDEQWTFSLSTGRALGRATAGPRQRPGPASARIARPHNAVALEGLPELDHVGLGFVRFEDPDAHQGEPREFAFHLVDERGRVILFDRTTSSVQAFDASGKRLLVARPRKGDLGEDYAGRQALWIAVCEDGGLLVRFVSGMVEFAADGQRIGCSGERDYGAPQVLFQPGLRERWELDRYHGCISLIDAAGRITRTIERGSNGRWVRMLNSAVVASDGSLALLDAWHDAMRTGDVRLHVFGALGDPVCSVELPSSCRFDRLAYDGRTVALLHEKSVVFFGQDGRPIGQVGLADPIEPLGIAFSPRGELWVVTQDGIRRLHVE